MMIVWRIRGKIIRTVLCCSMCHNCTQSYQLILAVLTGELRHVGLGLVSFCVFLNYLFNSLFVIGLVILCIVCLFFGCQNQCNRLPGKTCPRNDRLYVEQALNSAHYSLVL